MKTLEKILKGVVVTAMAAQLLLPIYSPSIGAGQYLNAQTQTAAQAKEQQKKKEEEQKKKKEQEAKQEENLDFKKAEEYLNKIHQQEKKAQTDEKSNLEKKVSKFSSDFGLKPVNFDVLNEDGSVFAQYRQVTYEQSKNLTVKIPERGRIALVDDDNRSINGFVKDMMLYYDDNVLGGHAYKEGFNFKGSGLKGGDEGEASIQMEKDKDFLGALRFHWLLLPTPDQGPKRPDLTIVVSQPGSNQPSGGQEEPAATAAEAPSKKGSFKVRAGGLIGDKSYSYDDCNCQDAFSGGFLSGRYEGKNAEAWASWLAQINYEGIANYGGADIKRLFTQGNIGGTVRVGAIYGTLEGRFSKDGHMRTGPDRTFAVETLPEAATKGVFGSAGFFVPLSPGGLGFEGTSIQIGGGAGYSNTRYTCTDDLMFAYTYNSEAALEKHVEARFKSNNVEIKYTMSWENNAAKDLNRKTQMLYGVLEIPAGKLIAGDHSALSNVDVVVSAGWSKSSDSIVSNHDNKWVGVGLQLKGKRK